MAVQIGLSGGPGYPAGYPAGYGDLQVVPRVVGSVEDDPQWHARQYGVLIHLASTGAAARLTRAFM